MPDCAKAPTKGAPARSRSPTNSSGSAIPQDEPADIAHEHPRSDRGNSQSETMEAEPKPQYPKGARLFFIYLGLLLVVLVTGLDRSIIATAVPKITSDFNSLPDVGWYGSAYLLTACCFQLLFGKLYVEFNTKWVFLAALVIFEVGSTVCAAAPNSIAFIIGRAVAGVGCAGLIAGSLIIIAETAPIHKRPKYTGIVGGSIGIAQIIAPTLGGVFADQLTWRWCFWINLPMGGITLITILIFLYVAPRSVSSEPFNLKAFLVRIDLLGTMFIMPAIIALLIALQYGGKTYSWNNWRIILCLVIFSVLTLIWLYHEFRLGEKATVPLRIIKQRSVAASVLFTLTGFSNFFIMTYWVPIWFQSVRDNSAQQSGINYLAATIAMSITTILTGFAISKTGHYAPPMIASSIIMPIGAGLIYTFNISTTTGFWVGALILFGVGMGLGAQAPVMAVQTVLSGHDIAIGTALTVFMQSLASAIFLSVSDNVFQQHLVAELAATVPAVDPAIVIANGASGLRGVMQVRYPEFVDGILVAYNQALRRVFLVGLVLTCLSIFGSASVEWVSVLQNKQESKEEAHSSEKEEKK
ncbi:putative Major facilitator superfamily (MFS) profile domain-containing protein [Seiridium cardinale]|uniref:Major facilitator superfamily (MFS) profile domain-containing protein n=1 Tax=Seiridium cardinale TaxID=138064 RepID=A0ABR2Y5F3_9PEZI